MIPRAAPSAATATRRHCPPRTAPRLETSGTLATDPDIAAGLRWPRQVSIWRNHDIDDVIGAARLRRDGDAVVGQLFIDDARVAGLLRAGAWLRLSVGHRVPDARGLSVLDHVAVVRHGADPAARTAGRRPATDAELAAAGVVARPRPDGPGLAARVAAALGRVDRLCSCHPDMSPAHLDRLAVSAVMSSSDFMVNSVRQTDGRRTLR